jgi:hypothetical protein
MDAQRHKGTHELIISSELFNRVQDVLNGHNRPKYRKHGLLSRACSTVRMTTA